MVAFCMSLIAQVPSVFFRGSTGGWDRRIFLVVCQSELLLVDRETRCLVNFSELIETKSLLSLFARLLNLRLSEGYFVLCQVARAVRFSEIRALICRGRFIMWFLGERGEEED